MLGINVGSFARRNAEKLGIKLVDLIEEAGALGKSLSRDAWLGIVISLYVPSIGRHLADRIPAFDQQFPEGLRVVNSAGKATSDSYNSDAVFVHKGPVGE